MKDRTSGFAVVLMVGTGDGHGAYADALISGGHMVLLAKDAPDALRNGDRIIPTVVVVCGAVPRSAQLCRHFREVHVPVILLAPAGQYTESVDESDCHTVYFEPIPPDMLTTKVAEIMIARRKHPKWVTR